MGDFVFSLIENFGYFGMFLGMVLEAVIIIIPSEAILATGGIISSNPVICECRGILNGDFTAKGLVVLDH